MVSLWTRQSEAIRATRPEKVSSPKRVGVARPALRRYRFWTARLGPEHQSKLKQIWAAAGPRVSGKAPLRLVASPARWVCSEMWARWIRKDWLVSNRFGVMPACSDARRPMQRPKSEPKSQSEGSRRRQRSDPVRLVQFRLLSPYLCSQERRGPPLLCW